MGRLRHLGTRREQLITEAGSQIQQMRDLLECVWPAALDTARQPFRSRTWMAALQVITGRDRGDLARTRRLGAARFEQAVRREITRRGGLKPCLRIVRGLFTALSRSGRGDRAPGRRAGAGRSCCWRTGRHTRTRLAQAEQRMTARPGRARADRAGHLDHRPVAGGCRGDPGRDRRPEAVRHGPRAGQARRPGATGETVRHLHRPDQAHRSGPPGLRLAAWRAVWGAQRANPVYAARYQHLTSREDNKLTPTQAQTVIAAAILRHLHAVITTGQAWDPAIAAHGTQHTPQALAA